MGAKLGLSPTPKDYNCQVKSGPIAQRTTICALKTFWQQMPRACSVARRDYSTLHPLFQLLPAVSSQWRGVRLADFQDIIRPAYKWGSLTSVRSSRFNEHETMLNYFPHRHVTPENATKVTIERARSRDSKTSLVDNRTSDPYC
jgi:hypothetical protein